MLCVRRKSSTSWVVLSIRACEEGLKIAKEFGSTCCKTLLVKNKKQFFLFVIPGEERFNAKQAAAFLKSSHLSFASPEDLSRLMHTFPGAVSLLGLIFDQNKEISLYIDSRILNAEHIDCHPCTNDRSLILSVKDVLEKFLPSLGVSYFEFQSGSKFFDKAVAGANFAQMLKEKFEEDNFGFNLHPQWPSETAEG